MPYADKYSIENIKIFYDRVFASTYEKDVPAKYFPRYDFWVKEGRKYRKDIVRYHLPFVGNKELLYYQPDIFYTWTLEEISIEDNCICFDIINIYDDPKKIKYESDRNIEHIERQTNNVNNRVSSHNLSLLEAAEKFLDRRKQHLLKKNDLLASLGVPIRKKDNFPDTFAVPTPQTRKKIKVAQPEVVEKGYKSEPTLELSVYMEILQVIHDVGKQFERMPSTYTGKDEEALRDYILLLLEPRFEGSSTGETYNKNGKTDILLRYQNSNVFIAECKFWKGKRVFLKTIDQLLRYLTWRDSKAAVVIFSRNKDFSSVIKTVESTILEHSNFVAFESKQDETWLNYHFHINDDPNREIKLTVLLFHVPPISSKENIKARDEAIALI